MQTSIQIFNMTPWQLFIAGGPLMWPVFMCSILSFAIILERFYSIRRQCARPGDLLNRVLEHVKHNRIKEAVDECEKRPSSLSRILRAGLFKHGRSKEEIKEALNGASLYEIPFLERYLPFLAAIAHISLLLGLLGTVIGMARVFFVIQVNNSGLSPINLGDFSFCIWEALLTTIFGLITAISAYIFYNILVSWVDVIILNIERAASELVNFLTE